MADVLETKRALLDLQATCLAAFDALDESGWDGLSAELAVRLMADWRKVYDPMQRVAFNRLSALVGPVRAAQIALGETP